MTMYSSKEDFIHRTRKIIESYDGEYDLTLLLNCCLGLIIISKESDEVKTQEWTTNVDKDYSLISGKAIGRSNIMLHYLRNSIAHNNIEPFENEQNSETIGGFIFSGSLNGETITIEMTGKQLLTFIEKLHSVKFPNFRKRYGRQ